MKVTFFHPRIQFEPIDPLADGLGEEIAREQQEPQAIRLDQFLNNSRQRQPLVL